MDSKRNIQILYVRKKIKQALKDDFENDILYYHQNGTNLQTVLSYLDNKILGGFYAIPSVLWVPLDDAAKIYPPFRVKYYKNRISIEFFYVLTDGTGGMVFLKALTSEYLKLLGTNISQNNLILDINEEPAKEEYENAFKNITEFPVYIDKNNKDIYFVDTSIIKEKMINKTTVKYLKNLFTFDKILLF